MPAARRSPSRSRFRLRKNEGLDLVDEEIRNVSYGCGSPIPPALESCTVLDLGRGTERATIQFCRTNASAGQSTSKTSAGCCAAWVVSIPESWPGTLLMETRFGKHFTFVGDRSVHYGPFDCNTLLVVSGIEEPRSGASCC